MRLLAALLILAASCATGIEPPPDALTTGGTSIAATTPATGGAGASSTAAATGGTAATGGVTATGGTLATGGTTATLLRDAGKSDLPPDACTVSQYGITTACAVWLDQTPPIVKCPWNMNCSVNSCVGNPYGPTPGVLCSAGGPSCACTR